MPPLTRRIAFAATVLALIGSSFGPVRSQGDGAALFQDFTWRNIGPTNMAGRVTDIEAWMPIRRRWSWPRPRVASGSPPTPGPRGSRLFEKYGSSNSGDVAIFQSNPAVIWVGTAIFIILTNPLDVMAYLALKVAGVESHRVVGQAGILDSARMRSFVAMELEVSVENIHCYVLGGHGDEMVPLTHLSNVAGMPLDELLPPDRLEAIVERTRKGGGEIVSLLKTGSAFYAPAVAVAQMVDAILKDKHLIIPASAYLQGEYDLKEHVLWGVGEAGS